METVFASSNTLDGIKKCISDFYCGEDFTLIENGKNWQIYKNQKLLTPYVIKNKGRFKFGH